jgi:hypothetical protein
MLKEDRNMWIMREKNFNQWLTDAGIRDIEVKHLLYTPPVPRACIPVYNVIDKICAALPIIRKCSLMLFGRGIK